MLKFGIYDILTSKNIHFLRFHSHKYMQINGYLYLFT